MRKQPRRGSALRVGVPTAVRRPANQQESPYNSDARKYEKLFSGEPNNTMMGVSGDSNP